MSQTETTADPWTEYEKTLAAANTANKTAVFEALAAAGITSVVITFNGEGDSGQMEDVVALIGEKPHKLPDLPVQFRHAAYGKPESEIRPMPLAEAIETLCYDYLSQEHGGW